MTSLGKLSMQAALANTLRMSSAFALCLLVAAMMMPTQRTHAQSNVPNFVVNTFMPSVVNAGRCGAADVYTSSNALSRSPFSPPYTGAIRWMRTGSYATSNPKIVRVDYLGLAAKRIKRGGSWTVLWFAEAGPLTCYFRRS